MMVRDERRFKMADKDGDLTATKEEFTAFLHPEEYDYMKDIVVQVGPLRLVIAHEMVALMAQKWMGRGLGIGAFARSGPAAGWPRADQAAVDPAWLWAERIGGGAPNTAFWGWFF